MKMEVLSVQNQFQGQFGVIGSTKVKDWTSPLTPPPPPPAQHNRHHQLSSSGNPKQQNIAHNTQNDEANGDVVDGRQSTHEHHHSQLSYCDEEYTQHQRRRPHREVLSEEEEASITVTNMEASTPTSASNSRYAVYNNNLLCFEQQAPTAAEVPDTCFGTLNEDIDAAAVSELSQRLQAELRAAKSRHLACTEVSLPWDLTPRIAAEIIQTSEREPCGVRGCTIFIEFEDEPNNTRRIASFKVDPNTVSTFELYLTLKHDRSGWTSLLPQFLKNLTRSSTILISPDFTLTKNKLYSCD